MVTQLADFKILCDKACRFQNTWCQRLQISILVHVVSVERRIREREQENDPRRQSEHEEHHKPATNRLWVAPDLLERREAHVVTERVRYNWSNQMTCRTQRERERDVLFNDTLNTFYLRLYGVRHMVKDHSDSEKGNPLPPQRLL